MVLHVYKWINVDITVKVNVWPKKTTLSTIGREKKEIETYSIRQYHRYFCIKGC